MKGCAQCLILSFVAKFLRVKSLRFGGLEGKAWEVDSVVETVNIALEIHVEDGKFIKYIYLCLNSKLI